MADPATGRVGGNDAKLSAVLARAPLLSGVSNARLGLNGQWRRVAHFDYDDPVIAWWGPWVVVSVLGGFILLASCWRAPSC